MAAITDLSSASSIGAADLFVISQGGTDKKVAASMVASAAAGTWTPTLKFGGTTVTGTSKSGVYAIAGNIVIAQCWVSLNGKNGSGVVLVDGLPNAAVNIANTSWPTAPIYHGAWATSISMAFGLIAPNTQYISLYKSTGGTTLAAMTDADFTTTSGFYLTAMYRYS